MKPFKKRRRGGLVATFEAGEAQLLANLAGQVVELLRDRNSADESDADPLAAQLGIGGSSLPPEDPVLQRLLPDAYPATTSRRRASSVASPSAASRRPRCTTPRR